MHSHHAVSKSWRRAIGRATPDLGDMVVKCLPPLSLLLHVRIEVAAPEEAIVHDYHTKVILSGSVSEMPQRRGGKAYAMHLKLWAV